MGAWLTAMAMSSVGYGCGQITPEEPAPRLPDTPLHAGKARRQLPAFPARPSEFDLRQRRNNLPRDTRPEPTPAEAQKEASGTSRNLEQEVRSAFGGGDTCMVPGALAGGRANLALSVVVSVSGRVTRATVAAPASHEALRCLREQAEGIVLSGPIEGGPVTVAATIPLRSPPAPEDNSAQEWKLPPGAETPGVVLPATGNDGLGDGYRPPDHTLPARGPSEMPDGFVPPGQTLPAQGPVRAPGSGTGVTRY